ncbi:hypothetical protein SBA1_20115 [Candidatus Sulfotelmatobacter kueseliae]|uniref:Uncharacterized protein n=1 Tax=Candidatus Sulfotelmatobacter kueseliae TaxID=2042962 RepID=A0A2U3KFH4_9BACT|nr:hypothetical protein SBA1_20115 [Candidatus Sulfotelmatobacter kueseliae]
MLLSTARKWSEDHCGEIRLPESLSFTLGKVCNDLQLLPSAEHGPKYITLPCVEKPGARL